MSVTDCSTSRAFGPQMLMRRERAGDVAHRARRPGSCARDPGAVAHAEARAGDDEEAVRREWRMRDVGLDAALLVAELGVDALARRSGDVVGGDAVERGVRALAR